MTVALISVQAPQAVIATYFSVPPVVLLPNGNQVYGVLVGWVSQDGNYSLVAVTPFVVPNGQQISGPPTYSVSNSVVTQTFPTQAIPASTTAQQTQQQGLAGGVTLTWSVSTGLNGTYPVDATTLILMVVEAVSFLEIGTFTNGTSSTQFVTTAGVLVTMTAAQFKQFFLALLKYVRALQLWEIQTAAGGTPTLPSSNVSVTG